MAATGTARAFEPIEPRRSSNEVVGWWKWLASVLVGIVMGMAPAQIRGSVTRAEVQEMLRSGDNPYVEDRKMIIDRLDKLDQRIDHMDGAVQSMHDDINEIAIQVGLPPKSLRRK